MAHTYKELSIIAARFDLRVAKARRGSQHRGMPVRYLVEDKNGVTPFRSLEELERMAKTKFSRLGHLVILD
jgi:hypothetical protein